MSATPIWTSDDVDRFEQKVIPEPNTGCHLWMATCSQRGYGYFGYRRFSSYHAHRVAWMMYRGEIPAGMHVLHKCDQRPCVNPDHLFLGDQVSNMRDMISKNRNVHGMRSSWTKLTTAQVHEIRSLAARVPEMTQAAIGAMYGCTQSNVSRILTRNTRRQE